MVRLKRLIEKNAKRHDLDPQLVACVVLQESGGETAAVRYEPAFYERYVEGKTRSTLIGHVPKNLPNLTTERVLRATSWGLMQVMGQTAREHGYAEDWLSMMAVKPSHGLRVGCAFLAWCFAQKGGNTEQALLRYNGGGNKDYAKEVLSRLKAGEFKRLY